MKSISSMLPSFSTPEYKSKILVEKTEPWIAEGSEILNFLFFKTQTILTFTMWRTEEVNLPTDFIMKIN